MRDFSARIHRGADASEEMRLLPTPVLEYTDPESKVYLGAVFDFATNGTNPARLVRLEPRWADGTPTWHYAAARMTNNGVMLKYRGEPGWQVELCPPPWTGLSTWTLFKTSRTDPNDPKAAQ